jgi:hypothetical protein
MAEKAEILSIRREVGVAGNIAYHATVLYPGESADIVIFHGNMYGTPGPVVMETPNGSQTFVTNPGRCGPKLNEKWVRAFFA